MLGSGGVPESVCRGIFDLRLIDRHFHLDDVEAVLEADQLRSDVRFVFAEELQALGFVTWPLPYQGCEFGELGKRHSGFA